MMKRLEIEPNMTYFHGARRKESDYRLTDKETGEVREGHSNKWRLFFITPLNRAEANFMEGFGSANTHYDVDCKDLPFIFGKDPKTFKPEMLDDIKGEPVILDIATTSSANGVTTAKLRGVMTVADFIKSMTEKK